MTNLSLGEKIKHIREGLGLNQTELAKLLGFKYPSAVSKYEDNSRIPDKNRLVKIAEMGNISVDELLTGVKSHIYNDTPSGESTLPVKENSGDYKTPDALFSSDQKINIEEAIGKTYKVLSAGTALSVALYMNIQQFAAALDTGQALKLCQDQMAEMQLQIDSLTRKVDALTAPSIAGRQGDGSA